MKDAIMGRAETLDDVYPTQFNSDMSRGDVREQFYKMVKESRMDKETLQAASEEVAEAVANEVIYHIDQMYPKMWEGVPKTARVSVRNVVEAQSKRYLAAMIKILGEDDEAT